MTKEMIELLVCLVADVLFTILAIKITYEETKVMCVFCLILWLACTLFKCITMHI